MATSPFGTITGIEYQQKRPDRVNVYLDGDFGFAVAASVVQDAGLRRGQSLSAEDVSRLLDLDGRRRAYDSALSYLSYRPRSEAEVRRNLERKGFAPELVDEAALRLRNAGLLDDGAFARFWVENRDAFSPRGARALRMELRQKGVSDETIRAAAPEDRDDSAAARAAAQRKAWQLRNLDRRAFRQRLGGYLGRRGFGYETIAPIVDALWVEVSAATAEPADESERASTADPEP